MAWIETLAKKATKKTVARARAGKKTTKRAGSARPKRKSAGTSKTTKKKTVRSASAKKKSARAVKTGKKTSGASIKRRAKAGSSVKTSGTRARVSAKARETVKASATVKTSAPAKPVAKKAASTKGTRAQVNHKPLAGADSDESLVIRVGSMNIFPPERTLPKTRLTPKQLEEFKKLLTEKRAELACDVRQLTNEALNQTGGSGDGSSMPIHMADLGSDNWEQEFTLGLIASERTRVNEIDLALVRIQNRTYGVCLATHQRIGVARLRAKPWAKYCIEYAKLKEDGLAP